MFILLHPETIMQILYYIFIEPFVYDHEHVNVSFKIAKLVLKSASLA